MSVRGPRRAPPADPGFVAAAHGWVAGEGFAAVVGDEELRWRLRANDEAARRPGPPDAVVAPTRPHAGAPPRSPSRRSAVSWPTRSSASPDDDSRDDSRGHEAEYKAFRRRRPSRPRRRGTPLGDLAGRPRVSGVRRDQASWRARSIELLHRPHEVAAGQHLVGDHRRRGPPRAPRRGRRRRSRGRAGGARRGPLERSSAARSSLVAAIRRHRCAHVGRREPRRRRRLRAAVLVHEHRQQPGERRRVEPVEQRRASRHSATSRSDSWNTRASTAPRRRQRPRAGVDVPATVEHVEHPVELPGQGLVVAVDAAAQLDQLALQPLGLAGGPHPLAQVGVGLDRVGAVGRRRRPSARRPAARSLALPSARATSRRYSARFGLNTSGSRIVPDARGTSSKSSAVRSSRSARCGHRRQAHPALAVGAGHDGHRPPVAALGWRGRSRPGAAGPCRRPRRRRARGGAPRISSSARR